MHSEDKYITVQEGDIINNKKRGDILYYSIGQVAALLEQEDSSIRYYTNVFDNILKIEIGDKELMYTNKDIDKLEFLITLKNKGMTIKEIQRYCEELPLDTEDFVQVKEKSSISIKEILSTIIESENEQINNLKEYLTNKIDESNELSIKKIAKLIGEEQNKQLQLFRESILNEIKEYIDFKFDIENKNNTDLYNKLSINVNNLISEKLLSEDNVKLQLDKFNQNAAYRDKNLIDEITRFKKVIEQAYYVQHEIDTQKEKKSFIGRLLGAK